MGMDVSVLLCSKDIDVNIRSKYGCNNIGIGNFDHIDQLALSFYNLNGLLGR